MSTQPPSWEGDENREEHYHPEWSPVTKNRVDRWQGAPRTPYVPNPNEPHPQALNGSGSWAAAAPRPNGQTSIDETFNNPNFVGGQAQPGYLQGGGNANYIHQSPAAGATPRIEASDQWRTATFRTRNSSMIEPAQTTRSTSRTYGTSRYFVPKNAGYDSGQGTGARAADSNDPRQWPPAHQHMVVPDANRGSQPRHDRQISVPHEREAREARYLAPSLPPSLEDGMAVALRDGILDPNDFKQITHRRKKFYVVGKVFMLFFIENAGETSDRNYLGGNSFTTVAHGEVAHHQFRRFVVVEERLNQDFCYCCPITTYGSRATTKQGVDQGSHTMVYSGAYPPTKLPGETHMNKDPLRIILNRPEEKLDPRVKDIGNVDEPSLPKLVQYVRAVNS